MAKKTQQDLLADANLFLAFDIGLKRTGVANGSTLNKSAAPAGTIVVSRGRHDWAEVDALVEQWQPDAIIIGDPSSHDPHLNKAINRFKSHIQRYYKLPIVDVDERLTSAAANESLSQRNLSQQRKTELRDQVAACLILETFFNSST